MNNGCAFFRIDLLCLGPRVILIQLDAASFAFGTRHYLERTFCDDIPGLGTRKPPGHPQHSQLPIPNPQLPTNPNDLNTDHLPTDLPYVVRDQLATATSYGSSKADAIVWLGLSRELLLLLERLSCPVSICV